MRSVAPGLMVASSIEVTSTTVQRGDVIQIGGQPCRVANLVQLPGGAKQILFESGELPTDLRMADFAHLCAQLDAASSLGALDAYRASLDDLNDDVIEGDLLAQTVLKHAAGLDPDTAVRMTSAEWLHALTQLYTGDGEFRPLPKGWPTTGKVLSDRLKRLQPVLAARGLLVDWGRTRAARYIEMTRPTPPQDEQGQVF